MTLEITTAVIASYRESSQGIAFSDLTKWPENVVADALCEADAETGSSGWGVYQDMCFNFKLRGMYLYASHWLATTYLRQTAEDPTSIDPIARLNVAAKTVADESVTFRIGAIQDTENDWLSLTNYGVQFLRLRSRTRSARSV